MIHDKLVLFQVCDISVSFSPSPLWFCKMTCQLTAKVESENKSILFTECNIYLTKTKKGNTRFLYYEHIGVKIHDSFVILTYTPFY